MRVSGFCVDCCIKSDRKGYSKGRVFKSYRIMGREKYKEGRVGGSGEVGRS